MIIKLEEPHSKSMVLKEDGLGVSSIDLTGTVFYPEMKGKVEPYSDSQDQSESVKTTIQSLKTGDRNQSNTIPPQRVMKRKRQAKSNKSDSDESVTKESDVLDVRKVTDTQSALDESPILKRKPRYYFRTDDDEVSEEELPS